MLEDTNSLDGAQIKVVGIKLYRSALQGQWNKKFHTPSWIQLWGNTPGNTKSMDAGKFYVSYFFSIGYLLIKDNNGKHSRKYKKNIHAGKLNDVFRFCSIAYLSIKEVNEKIRYFQKTESPSHNFSVVKSSKKTSRFQILSKFFSSFGRFSLLWTDARNLNDVLHFYSTAYLSIKEASEKIFRKNNNYGCCKHDDFPLSIVLPSFSSMTPITEILFSDLILKMQRFMLLSSFLWWEPGTTFPSHRSWWVIVVSALEMLHQKRCITFYMNIIHMRKGCITWLFVVSQLYTENLVQSLKFVKTLVGPPF